MKVFLTDGLFRKSLACARGLRQAGVKVAVGENTPLATAFFSKAVAQRVLYPSPRTAPQKFLDFLLEFLSKDKFTALFPMEEETLLLVNQKRAEFEKLTLLPFPPNCELEEVRHKGKLSKLAKKLGILSPQTFTPQNEAELPAFSQQLSFPLVLKPAISSGARGRVYVKDEFALLKEFKVLKAAYGEILLSEFIPGQAFAVSALGGEQGELLAAFVHRRLRTYPYDGGPSTLCESVADPELVEIAGKLFAHLKWCGVGQLEFIKDQRDGLPRLIEFNPRFWGSLQLAVNCGVNFPYLLLKMALKEKFAPLTTYKLGVKGRWFFPGELLRFLSNPRKIKALKELLSPVKAEDFIFSACDPLPLLGKMLSGLNFLFLPELRKFLKKR